MAIGSGRIGFAYLVDGELMDWRLSVDASHSEVRAFEQAKRWLEEYDVEALILEDPEHSRKGDYSLQLHSSIRSAAEASGVGVTLVPCQREAPNKYAEAAELAREFPQIEPWLPDKRRLWEKEPRYITLFEALSLAWAWWRSSGPSAEQVIDW
jgi:hypothetical protein